MLAEGGLLDEPWLADDVAALRELRLVPGGSSTAADRLEGFWSRLEPHRAAGADVPPPTMRAMIVRAVPEDALDHARFGPGRISKPHFALPVIRVLDEPTPLAAACSGVSA